MRPVIGHVSISEDRISHLPQSTVVTYKRFFCNICEDLNFVSQAINHII